MTTNAHIILGQSAEDAAALFLSSQGWSILSRNWRCRGGELDIVCQKNETISFVEVRSTSNPSPLVPPEQTVRSRKQTHLITAAKRWLLSYRPPRTIWRFDIIAAYKERNNSFSLKHFPNAFPFPPIG